ncbi:MAG: S41 family peptidase [Myxococcota bacterium]|nr:S41 family peptidase [Myxococcota bacterium]
MWFLTYLSCAKAPQLPTYTHVVERIEQTYPYDSLPSDFTEAVLSFQGSAKRAKTPDELRPVVSDLLSTLELSHYSIFPGKQKSRSSRTYLNAGTLGLTLRIIDDSFVVVGKSPNHPYPDAIELGWQVVSIDGELLPPGGDELHRILRAQSQMICEYGQKVRLEIKIGPDAFESRQLPCVGLEGDRFSFGNVPVQVADYHSEVFDNGIHYLRFHHFLTPIREPFVHTIEQAIQQNAKGLVIDLRGNTGGMIAVGQGFMGYLLSEADLLFAQQITKESEFRYIIYPRPSHQIFNGPLVVLIDELSISTAEIFARAIQLTGRGTIIGSPSAGRVLSSMVESLPNGDRLQLVIADLASMDNQSLEGVGVQPDLNVPYALDSLLRQEDAALQAAQHHILTQFGDSQ